MPMLSIFILFVLIVLYGLAWHDKPARPAVIMHRDNRNQPPEGDPTRERIYECKSANR